MDSFDLLEHEERVAELLHARGRVRELARSGAWSSLPPFREGKHCRYCPALAFCPAKTAALRMESFDAGEPWNDGELTPDRAANAWRRLQARKRTLERHEAILKDFARQTPIPLEHGFIVGERLKRRERLLPSRVREFLVQTYAELGGAAFNESLKRMDLVPKKRLRTALRRLILPTIPDGKITWLEREVLDGLRAFGAISATERKCVEEHRPGAIGEDGEDLEGEA